MNNYEFLNLIINAPFVYILTLFFSLLLYYFIYRKSTFSIIDPFFLGQVFSAIGFGTMIFLYLQNSITLPLFFQYVLSQFAFILGFFTLKRFVKTQEPIFSINQIQSKFFLYFFFWLIFFLQLYVYAIKGIPLFMDSRLELYQNGGGFGVLSRILDVSYPAYYFCFFILWFYHRNTQKTFLISFLIVLLFLLLSGSKSSFLMPLNVFFLFCIFINNTKFLFEIVKRNIKKIIPVILGLVLMIIYLQSTKGESDISALFRLGLRFIFAGDIYWYAYPNETYKIVDATNPIRAIFLDFIGLFRLADWSHISGIIGIDLYQYHHPTDILIGPNSRHNVFGLVYFGFGGSIIFSLFLGIITSLFRFLYLKISNRNIFSGIFYSCFYLGAVSFEIDPMLGFTHLNNILFFLPFLLLIGLILFEFLYKLQPLRD